VIFHHIWSDSKKNLDMPQFDFTTYSSQIFWFCICFATLYLTMHFVVLPRITSIINARKKLVDADTLAANELDHKITELQTRTDYLRKEASQKYHAQLEEAAKNSAKQREKSLEDLKEKVDSMTLKSRQELKNFVANSQNKSESAIQTLVQSIKTKIFS